MEAKQHPKHDTPAAKPRASRAEYQRQRRPLLREVAFASVEEKARLKETAAERGGNRREAEEEARAGGCA